MSVNKRKLGILALVLAVIAVLVGAAVSGAAADRLLTGRDIKNGSITTQDVKNGSVKMRDLSPTLRKLIKNSGKDGADGANGAPGANGAAGTPGAAGQNGADGSVAGVQSNWKAKDGALILSDTAVRLTNDVTVNGASVEIEELNLPVQAGKVVTFTYDLVGGAVYGGGSPRIFFEVSGTYLNTHDDFPADAGVDNGDGTFTKSWTITKNGRVGAAGIVMDSGHGSIEVSNVTVDGRVLKFR